MKESRVYIETSSGHKMVLEPYQVVTVFDPEFDCLGTVNAMTLVVNDFLFIDEKETVITLIEYLDEK